MESLASLVAGRQALSRISLIDSFINVPSVIPEECFVETISTQDLTYVSMLAWPQFLSELLFFPWSSFHSR
jgi:hypothetical protein